MVPNQVEISSDDYKFSDLLSEGVDFYHLEASKDKAFYLKDTRHNKLLNPCEPVRDHYPFRKNSLPQVTIIELDSKLANDEIMYITVQQMTEDINKASLMVTFLRNAKDSQSESLFLKTELLRSVNFPRKGIEISQEIPFQSPVLLRLDQVKKNIWMSLITVVFQVRDIESINQLLLQFRLFPHNDNSKVVT